MCPVQIPPVYHSLYVPSPHSSSLSFFCPESTFLQFIILIFVQSLYFSCLSLLLFVQSPHSSCLSFLVFVNSPHSSSLSFFICPFFFLYNCMYICFLKNVYNQDIFSTNTWHDKFWILLKILWKMEHLLQKSKCSIFHNIFKYMIFQKRQKALILSKRLMIKTKIIVLMTILHLFNCQWWTNPVTSLYQHTDESLFQINFNKHNIGITIEVLISKKAGGYNDISYKMLKGVSESVSKPLCI